MFPQTNPTTTPSWQALQQHKNLFENVQMKDLFFNDPERFDTFSRNEQSSSSRQYDCGWRPIGKLAPYSQWRYLLNGTSICISGIFYSNFVDIANLCFLPRQRRHRYHFSILSIVRRRLCIYRRRRGCGRRNGLSHLCICLGYHL